MSEDYPIEVQANKNLENMSLMNEMSKKAPLLKVSERIRQRLREAEMPFFANDCIADFIQEGELDELVKEAQVHIENLLDTLVIDRENDHNTKETGKRVAKMYIQEVMMGRFNKAPELTSFPNVKKLNEMMVVGPIKIRSMCAHHMAPIIGNVWIGVIPGSKLIGLSKFNRLAHWINSRPTIQEEATVQLADYLEKELEPVGLAVVLKASHFCMCWRGVKDDSETTTSVMRGVFAMNPSAKSEFLTLIAGHKF